FGEEARLADARLADKADGLAMAVFDLPKEIVQNRQLAHAIDKDRGTRRRRLAQSRAAMGDAEQTISRNRFSLALENEGPDWLDTRIALRQCAGHLAQEDRSGLGNLLKAGGDIRGIPDHRVIHRQVIGDRAEDDGASVNADAYLKLVELRISR